MHARATDGMLMRNKEYINTPAAHPYIISILLMNSWEMDGKLLQGYNTPYFVRVKRGKNRKEEIVNVYGS